MDPTEPVITAVRAADTSQRLIDQGVLGIFVLLLLGTVAFMWRAIAAERARADAIQAARLTDKDAVIASLTSMAEKSTTALVSSTNVSEQGSEIVKELRDAIRSLGDYIRTEGFGAARRPPASRSET